MDSIPEQMKLARIEELKDKYKKMIELVIHGAELEGIIITVETKLDIPLKIGHYHQEINVRYVREIDKMCVIKLLHKCVDYFRRILPI